MTQLLTHGLPSVCTQLLFHFGYAVFRLILYLYAAKEFFIPTKPFKANDTMQSSCFARAFFNLLVIMRLILGGWMEKLVGLLPDSRFTQGPICKEFTVEKLRINSAHKDSIFVHNPEWELSYVSHSIN